MSKEQIEEEFESFEEEMAYLVAEKSRLQVELSKYNKASLAREQMTIRKKYGNSQKSLEVWLLRSAELNDKRKEILEDLAAIEVDMREIKPMLQHEREQKRQKKPASDGNSVFRSDGSVDYGVVNLKMLEELKAIRALLSSDFLCHCRSLKQNLWSRVSLDWTRRKNIPLRSTKSCTVSVLCFRSNRTFTNGAGSDTDN